MVHCALISFTNDISLWIAASFFLCFGRDFTMKQKNSYFLFLINKGNFVGCKPINPKEKRFNKVITVNQKEWKATKAVMDIIKSVKGVNKRRKK
jgi:hypothetical protein